MCYFKTLIIRTLFLLCWPKFMFGLSKGIEFVEEKMNTFLACLCTYPTRLVWVLVSFINIGVEAVKCHHNVEGTKCKSEYCCPVNFKTPQVHYPQCPSIGVADFFLEK